MVSFVKLPIKKNTGNDPYFYKILPCLVIFILKVLILCKNYCIVK